MTRSNLRVLVIRRRTPPQESLRALPEAFRAGATVVGYDASGKRVTLKKGTNGMTCWADDPRPDVDWGNDDCVVRFPKSLEPLFLRIRELKDGKVSNLTRPQPSYHCLR